MRLQSLLVPAAVVLVLLGLATLPLSYAQPNISLLNAYLPMVFKDTQPPLVNGDFEAGSTGWSFFNGAFASASGTPHAGKRYAFLGGDDVDQEAIRQSFYVSPQLPYLEYWYNAVSTEAACTDDIASVKINTETKDSIQEFCEAQDHRAWRRRVLDLRAYSGQVVAIEFVISTDAGLASQWGIDDVALIAAP